VFSSPQAGSCAVTAGVEVPVGADTTADIQAQIAAITPSGETNRRHQYLGRFLMVPSARILL